jgi:hypothetical protein
MLKNVRMFSGVSFTAQYSNAGDKPSEKSPTPLVDKQKDTSNLKGKVTPVQDMQIGIPTAYQQKATTSQGWCQKDCSWTMILFSILLI